MKETSACLKFLYPKSDKALENIAFRLRPQKVFRDSFSLKIREGYYSCEFRLLLSRASNLS